MKKILFILLMVMFTASMSLFAVGCKEEAAPAEETVEEAAPAEETVEEAAPAEEAAEEEEIIIGVTMLNMANEFIHVIVEGLQDRADELGVTLVINDAERSSDKQITQVESFIMQGFDGIIVNPTEQEASSPAVAKAQEAKIPVVNVNGITTTEPDAIVASADEEAGMMAIEFLADKLNGKGNIVMMHGYLGQSAEVKRTTGAMEALEKYPDIKLIAEQTANWSRDDALTLMENWLTAFEGEIDCVFAQNDEMGMGALVALEAAGVKDDILLVSVDAIADALAAVKEGRLDATVFQDGYGQGYGAVDAIVKLIKGEPVDKEIMIPFQLVTMDNVDEFLK